MRFPKSGVLQRLTAQERQLDDQIDAVLRTEYKSPDVLYHYTSLDSAMKILGSRSIRATHFDDMEDKTELRAADGAILRAAHDAASTATGLAADVLAAFIEDYDQTKAAAFVYDIGLACFTPEGRGEFHWAEYGRGGTGVALGFEVLRDERPPENKDFNIVMAPVSYTEAEWEAEFRRTITDLTPVLNDGPATENARILGVVALLRKAGVLALTSKAAEFEPECEWRLVVTAKFGRETNWDTAKYDQRDARFVKYALRGERLPRLAEVVVGDKVSDAGIDTLRARLAVLGYGSEEPMPPLVRRDGRDVP